jgi:hypothetical protein
MANRIKELDLKIRPDSHIRAKYSYVNGTVHEGYVSPESVVRLLTVDRDSDFSGPEIMLNYKCILYSKTHDRHLFVTFEPPKRVKIKHDSIRNDEDDYGIELYLDLPYMLMTSYILKGYVNNSYLYALKSCPVTQLVENGYIELCNSPLGNVYTHNSNICWGSSNSIYIDRPSQVLGVIDTFFDFPFNSDLDEIIYQGSGSFMDLIEDECSYDEEDMRIVKINPERLVYRNSLEITEDIPPSFVIGTRGSNENQG